MAPDACVKNGDGAAAGIGARRAWDCARRPARGWMWLMGRGSAAPAPPPCVRRRRPRAQPRRGIPRPIRSANPPDALHSRRGIHHGSGSGNADEQPAHRVALSGFWMDEYEVTFAELCQFSRELGPQTGCRPAKHMLPVHRGFMGRRSARYALALPAGARAGGHLPLPTRREWSTRPRRAGVAELSVGRSANAFDIPQANYGCTDNNDKPPTALPGSRRWPYRPNGFGLFDMAGTSWEWCCDLVQAKAATP